MTRICVALVICMGCLVTENGNIPEEENFPPSIVSDPDAEVDGVALNQIIRVDLDALDGPEIELKVIVRDPNFQQDLQYQAHLDFVDNPFESRFSPDGAVLRATGFLAREVLTIRVPVAQLRAGSCQKVELLVSSRFRVDRPEFLRLPVEPEDFDHVTWWLQVVDDDNSRVDMDQCQ